MSGANSCAMGEDAHATQPPNHPTGFPLSAFRFCNCGPSRHSPEGRYPPAKALPGLAYSIAKYFTHTGVPTSIFTSVGVSSPVSWFTLNTITLSVA